MKAMLLCKGYMLKLIMLFHFDFLKFHSKQESNVT